MFTSLQTLRTHSLLFQYDVANALSHTEHVKRSLETSKIGKKAKSADFLSRSEPITVTEGERGGMWGRVWGQIFFLPKMFPSARKPRKSDYFTHLLCYFSRYFTFSFLFLWLFFSRGPESPIFNGNPKNRKFGAITSTKRRNLLKNPLEVPKRTLWRGYNSSLRSRVAHTEPISVTEPWGQGGPRGPKRENVTVPYKKSKLKTFTVQKRRNMVQIPFAGVHSSTFPSV